MRTRAEDKTRQGDDFFVLGALVSNCGYENEVLRYIIGTFTPDGEPTLFSGGSRIPLIFDRKLHENERI